MVWELQKTDLKQTLNNQSNKNPELETLYK